MLGLGRPCDGVIRSNRICRIWAVEEVKAIRKRREKIEILCFGQEHMKSPEGPFNVCTKGSCQIRGANLDGGEQRARNQSVWKKNRLTNEGTAVIG